MNKDAGLTLLELVIVIVIVGIIVVIVIPTLLSSRISANERSASDTMRKFVLAESTWFAKDLDGNGIKDFWTYDVSCLYRMYRTGEMNTVGLIPLEVARADVAPVPFSGATALFGSSPTVEVWPDNTIAQPKAGYWFQVLRYDAPASDTPPGNLYNKNGVGSEVKTPATNTDRYGFICAPDSYAWTGIHTYIVNELGVIYGDDTSDLSEGGGKWATTKSGGLEWPGIDPTQVPGPCGKPWATID